MSSNIFKLIRKTISKILMLSDSDIAISIEQVRTLLQQGELSHAALICREILARVPNHFDILLMSAEIAVAQKDSERAIQLYAIATSVKDDQSLPYYKRGNLLNGSGRLNEALLSYDKAIALDPIYANAYCNRGVVLERLGRPEEAMSSYDRAIAINPKDAFAYYNRATILQAFSRFEDALMSYDRAIEISPNYAEAYCNRGYLLMTLNRSEEALLNYNKTIEIKPDFYQAYFNLGVLLKDRGELEAALRNYERAITISPDVADTYCNLGVALTDLGRLDKAIASYSRAIELKPELALAYSNRADAYLRLNRFDKAIIDYDRAISLDTKPGFLLGALQHAKMNLCEWKEFDSDVARLKEAIENDKKASPPFYVLGLIDSPVLQKKSAVSWVRAMYPRNDLLDAIPKRRRRERIVVGYFSADFRDHATAHLLAELIDVHDRSLFEVIGFSFGPDTNDRYRKRLENSFDCFLDVRTKSNIEVASLARSLGVDIAVDLGGHTGLSRMGVFALRTAPLQVNYLGYPGTTGAEYIDYVIADKTLVSPETEHHFSERIIYLPDSYQVNDSMKMIDDQIVPRVEQGLPVDGFVFCCFNNNYKILPSTFETWMEILKKVPHSVLWLLAGNETAVSNLRQHAIARGVEPGRLIFASRKPLAEHLTRHRSADLFLDTFTYNAHTTASDALWAGLPLITCNGLAFAARVAASLLRAVDLPELIAQNRGQYVELAVDLAYNPLRLAAIRERLGKNRLEMPLFDARLFVKHLELAYTNIQQRYLEDLPPASIYVTSLKT